MAWISGKAAADLGSLLGLATGKTAGTRRGCWPGENESADRRGCWPDARDLPVGEITPEEAIRKITRGRRR